MVPKQGPCYRFPAPCICSSFTLLALHCISLFHLHQTVNTVRVETLSLLYSWLLYNACREQASNETLECSRTQLRELLDHLGLPSTEEFFPCLNTFPWNLSSLMYPSPSVLQSSFCAPHTPFFFVFPDGNTYLTGLQEMSFIVFVSSPLESKLLLEGKCDSQPCLLVVCTKVTVNYALMSCFLGENIKLFSWK